MTYEDLLIEIGAMRKDRQGDGRYYLTTGGLLFFGKTNENVGFNFIFLR